MGSSRETWWTVGISLAALAGCGGGMTDAGPLPVANFVRLQSDAGDYIGLGRSYSYAQVNATISVLATGGHFTIGILGDEQWRGDFQVGNALTQLEPGSYANLERYPFHNPVNGGLSWYGEGRGCNTLLGSFFVDSLTYLAGTLTTIDLRFEQRCEGASSALHGTIHWRGDDSSAPPGPVDPAPSGLWTPAPGATPTSGNYIYLESSPGDYIGQGVTHTYTPAAATVSLNASGSHLGLSIQGSQLWFAEFQGMSPLTQLRRGYYADLRRYPFHNPAKGGLSWYGEGRGCNTLTGWFVVDSVSYAGGTLTAISLRFEQHCDGQSAALHGEVHWTL